MVKTLRALTNQTFVYNVEHSLSDAVVHPI